MPETGGCSLVVRFGDPASDPPHLPPFATNVAHSFVTKL